jgi:hypothetical protein
VKNSVFIFVLAALCTLGASPVRSQDVNAAALNHVTQGTEIRLQLQTGLNSANAKAGDRFTATVVQPIYVDNQLVIPAGTTVNGLVGAVVEARRFALIRGEAAMSLSLRNLQADGRDIPVEMSIIRVEKPFARYQGRKRGDLRVDEGQLVEEKHDIKGDLTFGAAGTGGAGLIGAMITHVGPGLAIGAIGSGAYVLVRKGKEVSLPKDTGLLVRLDSALMLPTVSGGASGSTPGGSD